MNPALSVFLLAALAPAPPEPSIADRVFRSVREARAESRLPPLERRPDLDALASRRAEQIAALPENERLQEEEPVESLLERAGIRQVYRARTYVDLQSGALAPAASAVRRWRSSAASWSDAMDPRMDAIGLGSALSEDDWLVLVVVLLEDAPVAGELGVLEGRVLELVNQRRRDRGLPDLERAEALVDLARAHSRDMAARGYFSHKSPEGLEAAGRARGRGVEFLRLAENIARTRRTEDPARAAVDGWMESRPHRRSLLDPDMDRTGVGVAVDPDGTIYITQVYLETPFPD